jgi:hypothetical protein
MMKFFIEQIALCPTDPERAKALLTDMGALAWALDHVEGSGTVFGFSTCNEADLAFNYELGPTKPLEVEVLHYTAGVNWMMDPDRQNSVSHLGMHCTFAELEEWKTFFSDRHIYIVQSLTTLQHSNPVIAGHRRYEYTIFQTKDILGVDLKFIVRLNQDGSPYDACVDL